MKKFISENKFTYWCSYTDYAASYHFIKFNLMEDLYYYLIWKFSIDGEYLHCCIVDTKNNDTGISEFSLYGIDISVGEIRKV